jgi:hypothetical protein
VTANLAGIPAVSVPIGRVGGLPFGGQILAPWWQEEDMLAVAGAVEAAAPPAAAPGVAAPGGSSPGGPAPSGTMRPGAAP